MAEVSRGRYRARLGAEPALVAAALHLRRECFRAGRADDRDAHDALCQHLVVFARDTGQPLATCRLRLFPDGAALGDSYAAQFYGLRGLAGLRRPVLEIGRFCMAPGMGDPDLLRLIWGMVAQQVDQAGVVAMFGCTSLHGADPQCHAGALAALTSYRLDPTQWPVGRKAPAIIPLPDPADTGANLGALPAILRFYLLLGGRVSDHAVIDRDLDTLHVLTLVPVAGIPPAIARSLRRAIADG